MASNSEAAQPPANPAAASRPAWRSSSQVAQAMDQASTAGNGQGQGRCASAAAAGVDERTRGMLAVSSRHPAHTAGKEALTRLKRGADVERGPDGGRSNEIGSAAWR